MEKEFVKELLDLIKNTDVEELIVEKGDLKIQIRKKPEKVEYSHISAPMTHEQPYRIQVPISGEHSSNAGHAASMHESKGLASVKSPIVGTFYTAPSPSADPYVSIGDEIKKGQVLCIVEAMKLMNEIESDIDGKIVEMLVEDNQPVEFGEALFLIEP